MEKQKITITNHIRLSIMRYWRWLIPLFAALIFFVRMLKKYRPGKTNWHERIGSGDLLHLEDYMCAGFWFAAILGILCVVLLIATIPIWTRPMKKRLAPLIQPFTKRDHLIFWSALLLIVATALLIRLPRMNHSLWGDEEWAMRRYVVGDFKENKKQPDVPVFEKIKWEKTFFFNRMANNHVLQSVFSRCSLKIWEKYSHKESWDFDEAVLRIPSLLAGLGTLILAAWLLRILNFPLLGLLVAGFLAIHPWHIRYATEARGYAFAQFGILGLAICVIMMQRKQTWFWAIMGGLATALTILAWSGTLLFLVVIHCIILAILWRQHRGEPPHQSVTLPRWFAVHCFLAPWVAWIVFPSLPQINHQIVTSGMFSPTPDALWFINPTSIDRYFSMLHIEYPCVQNIS